MIRIIDTTNKVDTCYVNGQFHLEKWKEYLDAYLPGVKELCLSDYQEVIDCGYSWEKDFLPILNLIPSRPEAVEKTIRQFHKTVEHVEETIIERFGKSVDVDIILYLGLCTGAGWVTTLGSRCVILMGIEKIIELGWYTEDDMNGLVLHELGHAYQGQYGVLERSFSNSADSFLWQLFTEGIAMVFEQTLVGSYEYYHQDKDGWKVWCDEHLTQIAHSFEEDLDHMTLQAQRYFGDWVSYEGHGDTGYYLGARFVQGILEHDSFDRIIGYDILQVRNAYQQFLNQ